MTEPTNSNGALPMPRVSRKPKRNLAWVWLIPVVAALIGISIVWNSISKQGPKITIVFKSASGLEVGKTQIRYRDVVIGTVKGIRLSENRDNVVVEAELTKDAAGLANDSSRFWVVKPRIGLGGVSGLSTLFSGSYIEIDTSDSTGHKAKKTDFIGMENPPPITSDRPGTAFSIRSSDLGSLGPGSPVYFRRVQVGMVTDFSLNKDGKYVDLQVFIDAPYDKYVNAGTRFWNESGVDVSFGADGMQINTQSIVSLIAGGLSFASFGENREPVDAEARFKLYSSQKAAAMVPHGIAVPIVMRFYQSARGLKAGASVDFHGVDIGLIDSVRLEFDIQKRQFYTHVEATLYPEQLGDVYRSSAKNSTPEQIARNLDDMVSRGLRAQLRSSNLLTGQLYIVLADFPSAPKIPRSNRTQLPFVMATMPSDDLDKLQQQVSSILAKLDKIPFDQIGTELKQTLIQVNKLTADLNSDITPKLASTLNQLESGLKNLNAMIGPGSPLPANADIVLEDLKRTLRSFRTLTDSLQTQPESILLGPKNQPYSRDTLGSSAK
ncbi:MCE family protein [Orrella sp. NBD-18]|uniref:MCE family protein n=1 Tax=Sheuella amnicola TaxID=2707330 RepID=A0A6B2QVP3_9BURK|nr:MlaD family protein [Sheuella amnicola]NDY81718.1 MCE family protein [Sheuella amnicola]